MINQNLSAEAIQESSQGNMVFCKFLSANDTGLTGGHQAGIYISKPAISILFDEPGNKGENKEKWVQIEWQGKQDAITETRFIYYGQKTRNEYRITNFGKKFPYLKPEFTGALFVLIKKTDAFYKGYILNSEEEIDEFLDAFGISPTMTNRLIETDKIAPEAQERIEAEKFIASVDTDFPPANIMSAAAREISVNTLHNSDLVVSDPDRIIIEWTDIEFRLFRQMERVRYLRLITQGFNDVDSFVTLANQILNRRKSRAGKSLENHLAALFDANGIKYTSQPITEGNKKPDFVFPSEAAYHNPSFPIQKLVTLAAKTTCKDRWRQIINEADRLRGNNKFLCTLQQGISSAQMDEMESEKVILVVPKEYIKTYPSDRRNRIWTIGKFLEYLKQLQGSE